MQIANCKLTERTLFLFPFFIEKHLHRDDDRGGGNTDQDTGKGDGTARASLFEGPVVGVDIVHRLLQGGGAVADLPVGDGGVGQDPLRLGLRVG